MADHGQCIGDLCSWFLWPLVVANQIKHIYPYMIYLFENSRPRAMHLWPLQLILVTSKVGHPNNTYLSLQDIPFWKQQGLCIGKYVLFGWPPNQLQRTPLHCPWSAIFKKVYHVGLNMHYLVWFGFEVTQISCRGHHCNVLGLALSKRYIM